jgi:hypothetical protein
MEDKYLIYILETFTYLFFLFTMFQQKTSLSAPPGSAKVYWRCLVSPSWATGGLFFPFQQERIFFFILVEIFSGTAFFHGTSVFGHSNEYVANLLIYFRDAWNQSQSLPWLHVTVVYGILKTNPPISPT